MRRDSGQYVLHRFIKKKKDGTYLLAGDNRWQFDKPVRDEQILGVLDSVIKDGSEIKMSGAKQKLYAHLITDLYPIRFFIVFLIHLPFLIKLYCKKRFTKAKK